MKTYARPSGLPPGLKYGYDAVQDDRRFTAVRIGEVLARLSAPRLATQSMIDRTLFNLLVGNTDNHAKNTTTLRGLSVSLEVAPLYDVVPVFMDEAATHRLAFRIGEADYADYVRASGILDMMRDMGLARPALLGLRKRMVHLVDVAQVWAEQEGGELLADALSAQKQVVEVVCELDLEVLAHGTYCRLPWDSHHIFF